VEYPDAPALEAPAPVLQRLTVIQYGNAIRDLLSDDVVVPVALEPDSVAEGFLSVGAAVASVSARGVEQYEDAAYSISEQAMALTDVRDAIVPCNPVGDVDDDCAAEVVESFGLRAWRRPLSADEVNLFVDVAAEAGTVLESFDAGIEYALAGMLQSPSFLFREQLGAVDSDSGVRRFTDYEMATRLSFALWNTIPDEELLAAAEAGELTEDEGLAAQVDRLMASPRLVDGVQNLFVELYHLYELDELSKDPTVFVHMSDEVGPSAREETLRVIEQHLLTWQLDYRDLFTTRDTFLNRKLASIYDVPAPVQEGFGAVTLSESEGRQGLLGHTSFLALHAHPVSSSATLRGKFIRETLLCQTIPPPPADVDTSIPESTADAPTLRDRVAQHATDPSCAACHLLMDPIGLGLENFDGIGRYRLRENDVVIDATGDIDGALFDDAMGMGWVLRDHPDLPLCFVESLYRYSAGRMETSEERETLAWLSETFDISTYRVPVILRSLMMSPAFRQVGEIELEDDAADPGVR
jgi:hypothetical protein